MKTLYKKLSWPESQIVMELKEHYQEQCIPIDDAGYMIPVKLWESIKENATGYLKY